MKPVKSRLQQLCAALAIACGAAGSGSALATTPPTEGTINNAAHVNDYENQLITTLRDIQEQRVDGALEKIGELVERNPSFKLAQLIYADLLLARAAPIADVGAGLVSARRDALDGLLSEARLRWEHHSNHPGSDHIPTNLLQLAPETRHVIAVDLSRSRLYLFSHEQGQYRLLSDFYVSIGKNGIAKQFEGDKKTPIGVYYTQAFLSPDGLPDMYGAGAFPIDYPNVLDKAQGKTGYGIWLHGTPTDTYSRQPRASDGCITLSNSDLESIKPLLLKESVPVVIDERLEWVRQDSARIHVKHFDNVLSAWRNDWQSLDTERYLSHYSLEFRTGKMDYAVWAQRKKQINAAKEYVSVRLDNVEIFDYPGSEALRVVTFTQTYQSNNYNQVSRKQQYWRQEEDGAWRIIYEGPA